MIDSSEGFNKFQKKQWHKDGFKFFCKQIWKELNQNVWGKLLILVGTIYIIGNIIIKVFEFNRTIDLVFNIPLILSGGYLTIMYTAISLHRKD